MIDFPIKKLVLGITGGIAAYKAADLTRLLTKKGVAVQVVMTRAAREFIATTTMQALSGRPVFTDMWDGKVDNAMPHIQLAREADAILVAPASADFIAKLVNGLADDLLSTLCLARTCPLMLAPAMNRNMWDKPATRRNIEQALHDGILVFGPAKGDQACGDTGWGRMEEPEILIQELEASFQPKILQGKRVLITAGPTFEAIDAVRGISNLSSGKMGYAVARAAQEAGASVTLVSGPTHLPAPLVSKFISVTRAEEMLNSVVQEIPGIDIFIGVAAVADYHVANRSEKKLKKDAHALNLELAPNPDIIATVSQLPHPPFCVGFAAENENLEEHAKRKRRQKNLPLIAANLIQDALGTDESELMLIDDEGTQVLPRAPKITLARELIVRIAQLHANTVPRKEDKPKLRSV